MHILTVAYGHPTDPDAFDAHYEQKHRGLAEAIPGLKAFTALKCASLDGTPPPYYLLAQLTFDSEAELGSGMGSPAGQAAAGDVATFADGGATMFVQHD
ncbi:MAG: EthD family reductase [Actinomycetota bacterium]|nr:EthD family reductase [Actinomycetota bacterium]